MEQHGPVQFPNYISNGDQDQILGVWLVAYITFMENIPLSSSQLCLCLKEKLPDVMIPAAFAKSKIDAELCPLQSRSRILGQGTAAMWNHISEGVLNANSHHGE